MINKLINSFKENSKSRKIIFGSSAFLIVFLILFFSDNGIFTRLRLEAGKRTMVHKIEEEKLKKDSLYRIIEKLKKDTTEIERIAREKYGMVKPGEEIFFIKKKNDE